MKLALYFSKKGLISKALLEGKKIKTVAYKIVHLTLGKL